MFTVDVLRFVGPVSFCKSARAVDALKPVRFINSSKATRTVNPNKSACPFKPLCPVNCSKFVGSADVFTVNSNNPLRPVNCSTF